MSEIRLSNTQKIIKNTGFLFIAQILAMILSFFSLMYMGRYLGPTYFGVINLAIAFSNFFVVFADWGLSTVLTRDLARDFTKAKKYMSNAAALKLVLIVCVFCLILLIAFIAGYTREIIHSIMLVAISTLIMNFAQIYFSLFQAVERMEFQALIQVLYAVILFGGVIYTVNVNLGVDGITGSFVIASALAIIVATACSGRILHKKQDFCLSNVLDFDKVIWKYLFKESVPFGLSVISVGIYMWFDTMLLSLYKGEQSVGFYSAAYKIVMVFNAIPLSVIGAIFPVMARLYKEDSSYLNLFYNKAVKYMLILGLPIAAGITILSAKIITIVFGADYQASVVPLQILIWSEVLIFCSLVCVTLLNSIGKQFMVTLQCIGTACFSLIMNLILIPSFDYIGACVVNFTTYLLSFIFLIAVCEKSGYNLLSKDNLFLILKVCIAVLIMCLYVVIFSELNILLLISTAALIYFIILLLVKGINKSDIDLVRQVFRVKSS